MPKSISQIQNEYLATGDLDVLGSQGQIVGRVGRRGGQIKAIGLPSVELLLIAAASNFILKVKENLNTLGIDDTGALSDGIEAGELQQDANGYSITVGYPANSKAAKYYDYVNKGVKGFKSGTPNSPYSFKNIGVSRSMLKNIASWVDRNGVRRNDVSITKRQAKRESLSKMVSEASKKKSIAYAVAVNIKKKGLKKTGYFDNAVQEYFGNDFSTAISKMIGQDVKILIRQDGNNNQ
jgi:hypothetical protein